MSASDLIRTFSAICPELIAGRFGHASISTDSGRPLAGYAAVARVVSVRQEGLLAWNFRLVQDGQ